MKLKNETYDILKWIAQIFLPALTIFVGAVGVAVGFKQTDLIVIIMTAFDTFLGTILGISTKNYNSEREV
ncbi:phage holin [Peptostreptococcus equinus]|uniref:Holin n=1 Tax=Peptostreptococcus equinus TaxID=3003601 RepID=A0ABY7JQ69_9FIRM|nr:phage holin [Peptostreptococcus sp. CBA3647]WAW15304.1 holin [Peptostreptococcus sp. CBA3647]WAW15468.1 holin [Peptostreptococcus sp. CBA3647]